MSCVLVTDTETTRQCFQMDTAGTQPSHFDNNRRIDLGCVNRCPVPQAAFLHCISRIVCMAAAEEMIRPHAWRSVAAVENTKASRYVTGADRKRQTVGLLMTAVEPNKSVTMAIGAGSPDPAIQALADFVPEARYFDIGRTGLRERK